MHQEEKEEMITLYVVACMAVDPVSCKSLEYQTFKDKQECNRAFLPAMIAFASQFPDWTIKLMACGEKEVAL
jgi:hypothetical protein